MGNEIYIDRWLEHIRVLAVDIGPRGSTTDNERRASEYCENILGELAISPRIESFTSATSIYHPHLFAAIGMLIAFIIYPLAGRITAGFAAALSGLVLVSEILELSFLPNLLRWLVPKGKSQNVYAIGKPSQERRRDLILIGHVDSHRTPIIFRTPRWVSAYQAFTTIAFLCFLGQVILYVVGTLLQLRWIWPVSIIGAVSAVLLAALCIQADQTPFSAGANDNATGAGLVLTLAEQLKSEPLQLTQVWFLCSGSEEVQHYGAIDFFKRHRHELKDPVVIVFESLGCAHPSWVRKEGIIIPFFANEELVSIAEKLAGENLQWEASSAVIKGGNSEMADALRAGIPAITLIGTNPQDQLPYWHQAEDTFDKMDREVMSHAYSFSWKFIQELERFEDSEWKRLFT
jgi:hypothetical protein